MKYVRWYDKNSDLRDIFEFIHGLDVDLQNKIAQDIFQILMNDYNLNLDDRINSINKDQGYSYKRWYDNNIELFTSLELMKNFSDGLKQEIAKNIVDSIVCIYAAEC